MLPILQLKKLCEPPSGRTSRTSTVISISGFTSKDTDKQVEWGNLTRYFADEMVNSNIYTLNWEAKN